MRRWRGRAFALGGLAAGAAAALAAVLAALAAPQATVSQAQAADATTSVTARRGGGLCFTVGASPSTRTCVPKPGPTEIRYAVSAGALGGVAGTSVRAVIVRLTRKGTVWATLHDGAFYAAVPAGYRVRAVVEVLAGGRRTSFAVQ